MTLFQLQCRNLIISNGLVDKDSEGVCGLYQGIIPASS